jgi:hypothetical protein
MGRHATGSYSTDTAGNEVVRITVKDHIRVSVQLHRRRDDVVTGPLAEYVGIQARALFLSGTLTRQEVGAALSSACAKLREVRTPKQLDAAWADVLKRGLIVAEVRQSAMPTFMQVAEDMWLNGEVKRRYPGFKMRGPKGVQQARAKLRKYAYDLIGHIPIDRIEGTHLASVYNAAKCRDSTRVNLWDICRRVVSIAHKPLKLIPPPPFGQDDRPVDETKRRRAALEPQDDLDLMRCTKVSLHDRVWYGVLAREGSRVAELLALKRNALSDSTDTLNVWLHKTNELAYWTPRPGTVAALRAYHKLLGTPLDGRMFNPTKDTAEHYRDCLETAGVRERRPELWQNDDEVGQARRHDLRALFVTMALADERSDVYIRERTGHKSERMIKLYNRGAALYRARGFRRLKSLVKAIPELRAVARGEVVEAPPLPIRRAARAPGTKGVWASRSPARMAKYRAMYRAKEAGGKYAPSRDPATRRAKYAAAAAAAAQVVTANSAAAVSANPANAISYQTVSLRDAE